MTNVLTTTANNKQLPVVARMLANKRADLTRRAYRGDLATFEEFMGGIDLAAIPNTPEAWADLDPAHVAAYLEWLTKQHSTKTGRPYAPATVARKMTAVRELLTEAMFLGFYPRESLEYIKARMTLPEVTNDHHAAIAPADQVTLLELAGSQPGLKGLRDYAMLLLLLETGIRRAELTALTVADLTTKEGTAHIVVREGKGNKTRSIPIENYTAFVIRDWLKASGQDADRLNPIFCQVRKAGRGDQARYVVVNPGKKLVTTAVNKLVKWYCGQAGIESKITPHSFRASFVTDARQGGATNKEIMLTTGHADARMIDAVYDRSVYNEPVSRKRKHNLPRRPGELM